MSEPSLYAKCGGYDVLAPLFDHVSARISTDPDLSVYFKGHSTNSKKALRQRFVDYLCHAMGGPMTYIGEDIATAHDGLGITEREWDLMLHQFEDVLDKYKLARANNDSILSLLQTLKRDVVSPPDRVEN